MKEERKTGSMDGWMEGKKEGRKEGRKERRKGVRNKESSSGGVHPYHLECLNFTAFIKDILF
jgi:hypothetical protein